MATRNRTISFRKYRDALKIVRSPTFNGVTSNSTSYQKGIELAASSLLHPNARRSYAPLSTEDPATSRNGISLPPEWVDLSEDVASNLHRARSKISELTKAHAKSLMPSFGDDKEDQHRIETLTHEITDILRRSEKKLHRLSAGGPLEDSNVRKNVQRSLATELQSLSMELRKKQSEYLKRFRQQKDGPGGIDFEMNVKGSQSEVEDGDVDDMFKDHQLAMIKKSEALTTAREQEIQQVVESVNELAQIMKDLSVLVIDQGTIVDRIDYNIQNVTATVEEGLKQLQKAERTQKRGGMVKCVTMLIIICLVMLVLLIFKEILF